MIFKRCFLFWEKNYVFICKEFNQNLKETSIFFINFDWLYKCVLMLSFFSCSNILPRTHKRGQKNTSFFIVNISWKIKDSKAHLSVRQTVLDAIASHFLPDRQMQARSGEFLFRKKERKNSRSRQRGVRGLFLRLLRPHQTVSLSLALIRAEMVAPYSFRQMGCFE